ncbi:MAG TPA: type II toxin-antitoxin system VapC family toxin [Thermoanaerobaculia bacterium]|nr:type II toxin-antitoxin system VapC family toxin [Thermoanaerobaculia bacterium]
MVFDTMVLAYALLKTAGFYESSALAISSAPEIWAPDSLRAEMVNVLWMSVRSRKVSPELAHEVLQDVPKLVTHFVPTELLWDQALDLAIAREHPAYDTLFVALAIQSRQKVITFDGPLMSKFPEWTISVPDFLEAATA